MADEWLNQLPDNMPAWDGVDEQTERDKSAALSPSVNYGLQKNPSSHSETLKAANQLELPVDVADRNADEIKRIAKQKELMDRLKDTDVLKRAFENPDFAAVAHDDVDNLIETEDVLGVIKKMYLPFQSPVLDMLDQAATGGGITTLDTAKEFAAKAPKRYMAGQADAPFKTMESVATYLDLWAQADRDISAKMGYVIPEGEHTLEKLSAKFKGAGDMPFHESPLLKELFDLKDRDPRIPVAPGPSAAWRKNAMGSNFEMEAALSGAESLGATTAGMITSLATGTPGPMLATGFAIESGSMGQEMREAGYDPYTTALAGTVQGQIEVATERLPQLKLLENLKLGTGFGKAMVAQYVSELPQEQMATFFQDLNSFVYLRPNATFGDFLAERPSAAYQTLIASSVATTAQTGASYGTVKMLERLTGQSYPETLGELSRAQQAIQRKQVFETLERLAADSSLRERMPELHQELIKDAKGQAEDVYVDGNEFFQMVEDAGLDINEVAAAIPSIADQIEYLRENNTGDFRIPLEEYMTKVAGTEIGPELINHVRLNPEDMSNAEAEAWMAEDYQKLMVEEGAEILDKLDDNQEFIDSANRVQDFFIDQLTQTGRMTKDAAVKSAAIHKSVAATLSYRYPDQFPTPESVYEQYGLKVTGAPLVSATALEQAVPLEDIYMPEEQVELDTGEVATIQLNAKQATQRAEAKINALDQLRECMGG